MASGYQGSEVNIKKISSFESTNKVEKIRSIVQAHAAAASAAAEHDEQRPFRSLDDADEE